MAAAVVAQVKGFVGMSEDDAATAEDAQFDANCTLSKKTRLIGFGSCLGIGFLFSVLSFFFWTKPTSFALLYTLGNIVAVAATGFLIGFWRQAKAAFARKRVIATVAFILAIIGTLLAVLLVHSIPLAVVCIVLQFCALGARRRHVYLARILSDLQYELTRFTNLNLPLNIPQ